MIFDDNCPMMMEREFGVPESVPQVAVGFCLMPSEDKKKSNEAGRPIFREREYVKIVIPGDKNAEYFQPSTDKERKRFPQAYQSFKNRESGPVEEGTPIEQWPQVTRAMALTLKASSIHTVEALASVHDGNIGKIGNNAHELRAKAQAFIATAKDAAHAHKLAAENQALKDQIAALTQQVAAIARQQKKTKAA